MIDHPSSPSMPVLLTVTQVAEVLNLSHSTVLALINSGDLPAKDLKSANAKRSKYRVAENELANWIEHRSCNRKRRDDLEFRARRRAAKGFKSTVKVRV